LLSRHGLTYSTGRTAPTQQGLSQGQLKLPSGLLLQLVPAAVAYDLHLHQINAQACSFL